MLTTRQATAADIPLIRDLCFQVWPQTYASMLSKEQIDYMLDWMYSPAALSQQLRDGVIYLLCYDDATPAGFTAFVDQGEGQWKMEKLYVLPNQQGKGSGRFLLDSIVGRIVPAGARSLKLQVNKQNSAKGFYEKYGFVVKEAATFDIGRGFVMDDYVMELKLPR